MLYIREITSFFDLDSLSIKAHIDELNNEAHMIFSQQKTLEHSEISVEDYICELRREGGQFFVIYFSAEIVGTITLRTFNLYESNVGILIYEAQNNLGFATLAIQEATKLAKFRGNQSVSIGTHIANFPMRRVIEKSGFHILDKPRFVTARNSIHFIKDLL